MRYLVDFINEKLKISKDMPVELDDKIFWQTLHDYESGNIQCDILSKKYYWWGCIITYVDAKGPEGDNEDDTVVTLVLEKPGKNKEFTEVVDVDKLDANLKNEIYNYIINDKH